MKQRRWYFVIGILLSIWLVQRNSAVHFPSLLSPSPQPSSSATILSSDKPSSTPPELSSTPECLAEDQVQQITGKNLTLVRDSFIEDDKVLECSYQSVDLVKDTSPQLHYLLSFVNKDSLWQQHFSQLEKKSSFRTINERPNYFVVFNPVVEINMADFYGKSEHRYIELTYSPIQEDTGSMINKGTQLLDLLLKE
jgi:hypothetical protein